VGHPLRLGEKCGGFRLKPDCSSLDLISKLRTQQGLPFSALLKRLRRDSYPAAQSLLRF
jgi:hypothetical protein